MKNNPVPKLYKELAAWWPLLSPAADYAEEAVFFLQVMRNAGLPPNPTLLELGSGGGCNAFHMKQHFAQMTLTDLSPHMLAVSQLLNPECEHIQGDMRALRLSRTFDAVFVHDAIDYMLTLDDLRQAMATVAIHCKPNGIAFFIPDHVQETFEPSTDHGGTDGERRSLRYLEWTHDPDNRDSTYMIEFAYLLRGEDGVTQVEHDQHMCGLFARADWLRLLSETGFHARVIPDPFGRELFVARKADG